MREESPRRAPRDDRTSFAETALAGENERRRDEAFPRPARHKFKRHLAVYLLTIVVLVIANVTLLPGQFVVHYLAIVWGCVLVDNFIWAYVVDPDRDVAERGARRAERDAARRATNVREEE